MAIGKVNREFLENYLKEVSSHRSILIDLYSRLVQVPSETPQSDTREIVNEIKSILENIGGVEVNCHTKEEPIGNLVARLKGSSPGKRLIFNGHLDTYPVG